MVGGGGKKGRWGFKGEREEREMTGRCLRERGMQGDRDDEQGD